MSRFNVIDINIIQLNIDMLILHRYVRENNEKLENVEQKVYYFEKSLHFQRDIIDDPKKIKSKTT